MKSKFDGQIIQYVPHGFQHVWAKLGWVVETHILQGTHHGLYADAMIWAGDGEAVFPTQEEKEAA